MYALRPRDDFFPSDEHVKGVAVAGVLRVRHGVEGPHLHLCNHLIGIGISIVSWEIPSCAQQLHL